MSFENDKYSVDKDPYEWCLTKSKSLKAINTKINIQMRSHKVLTQMQGELENAINCRFNQSCTLDHIANTLQDVRKRTNIGKYSPYKRSSFRNKQPFRVEIKEQCNERTAEVTNKKNSCHNFPEEQSQTVDSDSESMVDSFREHSDDDKDPKEEFMVKYQEEKQLETQDIQLEA
ncbi:hypothetical protein O181_007183 [Austropuccinia psidii MF-1]|uniref:Uncharacterized protein n=1 Tax=Austropuccinia psidii MF-1 TaxID=1389203 RepID=A0A9Q3GHB3_9BASI|nr:hypothetical protein [Austropuccinia psidii MF-1]